MDATPQDHQFHKIIYEMLPFTMQILFVIDCWVSISI